jgi:large conductance mechanosensitive channel
MIKGFKEFILRGNVIDLAVGVVIGAAFTAVVNALVQNIFNPVIGALFNADSLNTAFIVTIPTISGGSAEILFGAMLAVLIQFFITAFVIYLCVVLPMNTVNARIAARVKAEDPADDTPPAPTDVELLAEIRDLLRSQSAR